MKKKPLLFALLALAIVTSLTAGTLAVYTKSVSLAGDVKVKKFAFTTNKGNETSVSSITLAPTESMDTTFSITNKDEDNLSEVPLKYNITVDIKKTAEKMVGLTAELLRDGTKSVGSSVNGIITYESDENLTGGKETTHNYTVRLTWNDATSTAETKKQTDEGFLANTYKLDQGLNITVAATQATPAT